MKDKKAGFATDERALDAIYVVSSKA